MSVCFRLPGFDLATRDSNFTILAEVFTDHILAKNTYYTNYTEWPEHKITVLKPGNNHQIIQQCHGFKSILINDAKHHPFFLSIKSFVNITFYEAENDKSLRQDDSPFKSLFTISFA